MKKNKINSSWILPGKLDVGFLVLVLSLLVIGLIMLFSASYPYAEAYFGNSYHFIIRQAIFAVVGVIIMLAISKINFHKYKRFAWILYLATLVILAVLLIMPAQIMGVKRWIVVGSFNFQPSEIAKFAVILLFSALIANHHEQMQNAKFGILFMGGLLAVPCLLVFFEPHISATILIFAIGLMLMFVGGIKKRYIAAGGGVVGVAGLIFVLSGALGYAADRLQYWFNPWSDASGKGYQTIQSLLAIGSGGIMGRGFGKSRQKYLWLPEPHNDFIFSIVCEELGLIGALIIIALFCALIWRGFVIAMRCPDKFGSLLSLGITFQVGLQVMLNILVVTNTMPNTGISLPFFSYGGTALLILLAQMGIVLAVSRTSTIEKN